MKQTKIILLTVITSLCAFIAIIYSSCSKDKCKGVSCQNGVKSCIDGTCQCPAGYAGNFCELSSITFRNDTYTPIYINVSGYTDVIPVDSSVSYTGTSGESVSVYAYTFGTNVANNLPVGDSIQWSFNDNFPVNGASGLFPLDVYATYFYLNVIDSNSSQSVDSISVNYNIPGAQTPNYVTIPNDKKVHGVGYYVAYPLTQIYAASGTGHFWTVIPAAIPDTILNEVVTITLN